MNSPDPFVEQHKGLVEVHQMILGSFRGVASAEPTGEWVVPQALAAGRFLILHHHAEDSVLFPGLRRWGRLRTADAAFLEARDKEHKELHALAERLLASAEAAHPGVPEIRKLAEETVGALGAHVAEEEAGLSADRLREMISVEGLAEINRGFEKLRAELNR